MSKIKQTVCLECDGDGGGVYTCCGDNVTATAGESDICPSCGEHSAEWEDCEECLGTGKQL